MRPQFEFTADSAEPELKSGEACWKYKEPETGLVSTHTQRFNSFTEAFQMNMFVAAMYERGRIIGRVEVCKAVETAMEEF